MTHKLTDELQSLALSLESAARAAGVESGVTGLVRTLTPDEPIHSSSEDRLNRSGFAAQLAKGIVNFQRTESLVVGIYGRWGTGKTSLLNLIEEHLQTVSALPPIIFRFNPWGFSDQDQLTMRFFADLSAFLKLHISIPTLAGISESVEEYGELFSPVAGLLVPRATEAVKAGWRLFRKFRPDRRRTVGELKAQINSALTQNGSKLIIMVDDIDRLNQTEVRQVFQLVKLNANFANTVYLVAFDERAVEAALAQVAQGSPKEYLEKIVQVSFSLPPIQASTLTEVILAGFNDVMAALDVKNVDTQRFGNMFHSGFRDGFQTIRDVNRYFNLLRFALNLTRHDTDFVDLAGVEALAVFYPEIYHLIEGNPELFSGVWRDRERGRKDASSVRDQYEKIFQSVPEEKRKPAMSLCTFLFPKVEHIYGGSGLNTVYEPEFESHWRKGRRVAAAKYFPYYFQLAVPDTDVSRSDLDKALESAESTDTFVETLRRFKSSNRFGAFIDTLRDSVNSLSREQLLGILRSIFVFGDETETEGTSALGLISDHLRFGMWLLFDILDGLPHGERFGILAETMMGQPAVFTISKVASTCEQLLSRDPDAQSRRAKYPDLTKEAVDKMRTVALDAINRAARQGRLQLAPRLPFIFYRWKEWGDSKSLSEWIASTFLSSPKGAAKFVSRFAQRVSSFGLTDKVPTIRVTVPLKPISDFADLNRLAELLRIAPDTELSEEERLAKERFLAAKAKLDAGGSLDDPFLEEDGL